MNFVGAGRENHVQRLQQEHQESSQNVRKYVSSDLVENSSHVSSRQVENVSGRQCKVPHSVVVAPHSDYPKNVKTICERTLAKGGIEPTNKMTENNTELLATKYWKWGSDENTLNTLMPPLFDQSPSQSGIGNCES